MVRLLKFRLLAIRRILKKLGIQLDKAMFELEPELLVRYNPPDKLLHQIEYWQDRREELTKQQMKDL